MITLVLISVGRRRRRATYVLTVSKLRVVNCKVVLLSGHDKKLLQLRLHDKRGGACIFFDPLLPMF